VVVERLLGQAGAQGVEAIERGFLGDLVGLSDIHETRVRYREFEMLGHLVFVEHGADGHANLRRAKYGLGFARDRGGDPGQIALGGFEQVLALAGALARQIGVATNNQPLTGKLRRRHRRQIAVVEQRHLQIAAADEALQRGRARR